MFNCVTLCSATLGEDGNVEPPLGALYIAAAIEQENIAVDFRDYQQSPAASAFEVSEFVQFLAGHEEHVLISCFVDMLPIVVETARILVEKTPGTKVVLGGPGPSAGAAAILQAFPWIYGIVVGEGEETVRDWLRTQKKEALSASAAIPGMLFRSGTGIVDGGRRVRIRDLDEIAPPAYHLIDCSQYTAGRIITTRGCSYRCSFCDVAALWNNRSTFRSIKNTIAEMTTLSAKWGFYRIGIADDTFVLNVRRVREFCAELIRGGYDFIWGCFGRINLMTPDLIELMATAGCKAIFYGIDSGSPRILERTVKRLRVETVMPVLRKSAECFDTVEASFIWGYPFETLEDFNLTIGLAAEASRLAPAVNVQLHLLSPLPNSPIYHEFSDHLCVPEPADKPWLLLPGLLLDERSEEIRQVIERAPSLFPGFFCLPTPDKPIKRGILEDAFWSLNEVLGSTIFDSEVAKLLTEENPVAEQTLLAEDRSPAERIGVGLAVGALRRGRRRSKPLGTLDNHRRATLVRQRNDQLS